MIRVVIRTFAILSVALFSATARVHAQSTADATFNAWNAAFLVQQSGQAFYANALHGSTPQGSWVQALDIEVAEDTYLRSRTPVHQKLVSDLVTHFLAYENYDWN